MEKKSRKEIRRSYSPGW